MNQQKAIVEYCNQHGIFVEAYAPLMRTQWDISAILDVAKKVSHAALHYIVFRRSPAHPPVPSTTRSLRRSSSDGLCSVGKGCFITRVFGRSGGESHFDCRRFGPLPKSADPKRVVSNVDIYDFEIGPEDMKALDALDRGKEGTITWNPVDVD